ncbi:bifunctional uridylate/adenylate kinase [Coemansia biformis]|uniref:Uridylate kinase n=1 Tax=Coemansia biformis TaxID=1286918 RepID=A0A9W8CY84_9FUNG|nr:bifunctional uridylate/adenylate kinase [Coemansia biformis]
MHRLALLRSLHPRLAATQLAPVGRVYGGPLWAGALVRAYSAPPGGPKLDQARMGQSSGKRRSGGVFGFQPLAVFAAVTLLASGYALIIKPYLAWKNRLDEERMERDEEEQAARGMFSEAEIAKFPFAQKTVVFVLGGPGSGKGTNSAKLVDDFGFVHLSAGDLLREEQKRPVSQYGELIAHYIREGLIVPHEITIGLLRNAMMSHPESDRFLIDGFPRNLVQAKAFEDTVCKPKQILFFDCPEKTMLDRLLDRGKTSGRSDDNIESIKKRFRTYVNDSRPVIESYAKEDKVMAVSCQGTPDDVYNVTRAKVASCLQALEKESGKSNK